MGDYIMKELVSIIAPMYNEENLVHAYCQEVLRMAHGLENEYDFEIVLVNDGSKDETYNLMLNEQKKHPEVITTICLSRNFGLEGAVNAGIRKAKGDAVVVMDADLQDSPALIPLMLEKWKKGADIVVGSRIKRSHDGLFKKIGAGLYYKVLDELSGKIKLEKSAANFRLLSRKAIDTLLTLPENNSVFRVVVPFIGMKTDVVEYDRDKRYAGKTKYNLKSMIPYALNSITGISVEPLRKVAYLQIIPFVGAIISMIGIFVNKAMFASWLIVLVMNISLEILLISISVVAEYIAQIMIEVKGRPISIIYDYTPSNTAKERETDEIC